MSEGGVCVNEGGVCGERRGGYLNNKDGNVFTRFFVSTYCFLNRNRIRQGLMVFIRYWGYGNIRYD